MIGVTIFVIGSLTLVVGFLFLLHKTRMALERNRQLVHEKQRLEKLFPEEKEKYERRLERRISELREQVSQEHVQLISQALTSDAAKQLTAEINKVAEKSINRTTQEFLGNISDEAEGLGRDLNFALSEQIWDAFQQFKEVCKDSPYLIPIDARIYYTKGNRTVVCIEQEPQVRLAGFEGDLATNSKRAAVRTTHNGTVYWYELAFPYVYFFIVFDNGVYNYAEVYFSNRKIDSPKDVLYLAPLPNIFRDKDPKYKPICIGGTNTINRIRSQESITEQCRLFVDTFWKNTFNPHLGNGGYKKIDNRMKDLKTWQASTAEDPLFILTVEWKEGRSVKGIVEAIIDRRDGKHALDGCDQAVRNKLDEGVKLLTARIEKEIGSAKAHNQTVLNPPTKDMLEEVLTQHTKKVFEHCSKV